jgi:hypothetical protein
MEKYASNVIEKCIESNEEFLEIYINEICLSNGILGKKEILIN